jgi:hypothetical protein
MQYLDNAYVHIWNIDNNNITWYVYTVPHNNKWSSRYIAILLYF